MRGFAVAVFVTMMAVVSIVAYLVFYPPSDTATISALETSALSGDFQESIPIEGDAGDHSFEQEMREKRLWKEGTDYIECIVQDQYGDSRILYGADNCDPSIWNEGVELVEEGTALNPPKAERAERADY